MFPVAYLDDVFQKFKSIWRFIIDKYTDKTILYFYDKSNFLIVNIFYQCRLNS